MARQRKGLPVHGWLVLDKPQGMTSMPAVAKVKRLFAAAKAGHAGTLDPLATGVLPIALGEATKTMPFVVEGSKAYRCTVRFGAETDTDDTEGKVTATSAKRAAREEIKAALARFEGTTLQVPPRFSAVRVSGERAYDLAREEQDFELAPREVHIESLHIAEMPDPDTCVIEAVCSKGTYLRALARDLGRALGSLGHVSALRRLRVGNFDESRSIGLARLEDLAHGPDGRAALMTVLEPVETALADLPALTVSGPDAARLKQGRSVLLRGRDAPILTGPVYAVWRGTLVALGDVARGELKPKRIFNLSPERGQTSAC
jgi:tRNA pseudouridine55 synthase